MKDLLQKLKTLTTSHHGELGFQSRQFEDLKAFIEENRWYTMEEKAPPQKEEFLVELSEDNYVCGCRVVGNEFETSHMGSLDGDIITAAEIVKWRKFPTT